MEDIQDSVEAVLIAADYADVAKGYILYRKQREKIRNMKSTVLDYKEIVDNYVHLTDWRVKENSTVTYSVGGLILSTPAPSRRTIGFRRSMTTRSPRRTATRTSTSTTFPCSRATARAGR